MSAEHVLTMLNEHEVKFVDLRFTDTKGKEQHVTIPSHQVNAEFFEEGKMFDGSSIGGWKGINESDMVLMPDATTALIDPFYEEPTLIIRCDILEPGTLQGYERPIRWRRLCWSRFRGKAALTSRRPILCRRCATCAIPTAFC